MKWINLIRKNRKNAYCKMKDTVVAIVRMDNKLSFVNKL